MVSFHLRKNNLRFLVCLNVNNQKINQEEINSQVHRQSNGFYGEAASLKLLFCRICQVQQPPPTTPFNHHHRRRSLVNDDWGDKTAINTPPHLSLFILQAIVLFGLAAISVAVDARRVRIRTRPVVQPEAEETASAAVEDSQSQGAIQYYSAEPQNQKGRVLLLAAEDEYTGQQQQYSPQPQIRPRADYNVPSSGTRHTSQATAPRTKESAPKEPPVQTIRNYSNVNDDGSFTFGYEAADGSFKEETRGTDCVVRGKYGYVDPDGNKREFTYVSGNPCDPNNPDGEEEQTPEEETEENLPQNQNYPKRVVPQRPVARPIAQTTPRAPTTVFQNNYNPYNDGAAGANDDEEEENVPSYIAPRPVRPLVRNPTTPASVRYTPATATPRPIQSQPPATTYRPSIAVTQRPVTLQSFPSTTPLSIANQSPRRPIDFASEFQKFQDDNKQSGPKSAAGGNAIYQSQLVFDPSTGQYDANLYQQLPKAGGDFELNQRIQPYVAPQQQHQQQPQYAQSPQLVTLDQLRGVGQEPAYARPAIQTFGQTRPPQIQIPQFSQHQYAKSQENLQVLNSQQLFAQQTQLAHQQLNADRIRAAERQVGGGGSAAQRFQYTPVQTRPPTLPQAYYYVPQQQQGGSLGQIDSFLKGQNVEY